MSAPHRPLPRVIQRCFLLASNVNRCYELISTAAGMEQWFCQRAFDLAPDLSSRRRLDLEWDTARGVEKIEISVQEEQAPPLQVASPLSGSPGPAAARFNFSWPPARPAGYDGPMNDTRASFLLHPEAGGTRLIFNETGFGEGEGWDHAFAEQSSGWDECFAKLKAVAGELPTRLTSRSMRFDPAAAEQLWQALTDPQRLGEWFEVPEHWDARPGGAWRIETNEHGTGTGRFIAVEPGRLLSLTWDWYKPGNLFVPSEVIFELETEESSACTLMITHRGFGSGPEWDYELDDHDSGWFDVLKSLDAFISGQRQATSS